MSGTFTALRLTSARLVRAALLGLVVAIAFAAASDPLAAQFIPINLPAPKPGVAGPFVVMAHANQRIFASLYDLANAWQVTEVAVQFSDPSAPVPPPAVGGISVVTTASGKPWMAHRTAGGQVYVRSYQQWNAWPSRNVTGLAGAPAAVSDPIAFDSGAGYSSIVYRGSNGHIYELFTTNPFGNVWQWGDLSAWTNAPAATGTPAAYVRSDLFTAVLYRGTNGHIYELYRPTGGGANWQVGDLTALTAAPLAAGDPFGFQRSDWYNVVLYRGSDRQIYQIEKRQSGGVWEWSSPSAIAQAPLAKGNPSGYSRWDGVFSIVYRGQNDHIYEIYRSAPALVPDSTWRAGDLTLLTSASPAAGDPAGWWMLRKAVQPDGSVKTEQQNCVAFQTQLAVPYPLNVLCLETGPANAKWRTSYSEWPLG